MDMNYTDLSATWNSVEKARQAVVERTLFEVFNPFASLPKERQVNLSNGSVISYTVQEGDTLSKIAERYGMTLRELVEENKLTNPNMLGIGMKLVVKKDETTHMVEQGETVDSIAKRYYVTKEEIAAHNPVVKILDGELYVGQVLRIPLPQSQPMLSGNVGVRRQAAAIGSRSSARARLMDWPIAAPTVTSGFGMRWGKMHKGIDLWNEDKGKTQILAAKDGKVTEAGANRAGYGYMVVLDHGDGLQTMYAHMRKIIVQVGDEVKSGDTLGYMGRSGDSTDYHLHFEVRQDNVPINPMRFLRK